MSNLLPFALPAALAVWLIFVVRARSLRVCTVESNEKDKISAWRLQLSRGDLVQFRLISGTIIDDAEVVLVENGRRRMLVSSLSQQQAWVMTDALFPPSHVFQ